MSANGNPKSSIELTEFYGVFSKKSAQIQFDESMVPSGLKNLVPYARFWGASDDSVRGKIVAKASSAIRKNLVEIVQKCDSALDEWLANPESDSMDEAYIAFSAMRMAADEISVADMPISEDLRKQRMDEILKAINGS